MNAMLTLVTDGLANPLDHPDACSTTTGKLGLRRDHPRGAMPQRVLVDHLDVLFIRFVSPYMAQTTVSSNVDAVEQRLTRAIGPRFEKDRARFRNKFVVLPEFNMIPTPKTPSLFSPPEDLRQYPVSAGSGSYLSGLSARRGSQQGHGIHENKLIKNGPASRTRISAR